MQPGDWILELDVGYGRRISLVDLAEGWARSVLRHYQESGSIELQDPWGVHDFIGSLYTRDTVEEWLQSFAAPNEVPGCVQVADELLMIFTEEQAATPYVLIDPEITGVGWWWRRLPRKGPVRQEFDEVRGSQA